MGMRVQEIFTGVSGECGSFLQGSWCTFVRLAGCNLRCKWCDTVRAQEESSGVEVSVAEVARILKEKKNRQILITGGEPLLQMAGVENLVGYAGPNFSYQIETNGSILPSELLLEKACCVFDFKLESSGMMKSMLPLHVFSALPYPHWIKFVIADKADYEDAKRAAAIINTQWWVSNIAFSACPPGMTHNELYQRMKTDGLTDVLLSVQIHKLAALIETD